MLMLLINYVDTVSAESIRAQMPHGTLTHITGDPTHKQLKILKKELAANFMAIPCPWGKEKVTSASSKTLFYTFNKTAPLLSSLPPLLPTIPSIHLRPHLHVKRLEPPTSPNARRGTHT